MRRESPRLEPLISRANWVSWRNNIEKHARLEGVWEYCDPEGSDKDYPELQELEKPHISSVRPGATSIVDLGEADFAELSSVVDQYWKQFRAYEEVQDGLYAIFELIKEHVTHFYLRVIENAKSPREQLTALSLEMKKASLETLQPEWELIQLLAQGRQVQQIFELWNEFFASCAPYLGEHAQREYAFWDCLQAAADSGNNCGPLDSQRWIRSQYQPANLDLNNRVLEYERRRAQAEKDWNSITTRYYVDGSEGSVLTEAASQSSRPTSEDAPSDQCTEALGYDTENSDIRHWSDDNGSHKSAQTMEYW